MPVKRARLAKKYSLSFYQKVKRWLPLIGFAALCLVLLYALNDIKKNRAEGRRNVKIAIAIGCQRLNVLADNSAESIYNGWNNLKRDADALGIALTPRVISLSRFERNKSLGRLIKYDCSTLYPPGKEVTFTYRKILANHPTPTIHQAIRHERPRSSEGER